MANEIGTPEIISQANYSPRIRNNYWVLIAVVVVWVLGPNAGSALGQSYLDSIGIPTFTTSVPVENGFVNAANGNLHLEIPLGSSPGRTGRPYNLSLSYDSAIWSVDSVACWEACWQPSGGPPDLSYSTGWHVVASSDPGWAGYTSDIWTNSDCTETFGDWVYIEPNGTQHTFGISTVSQACGGTPTSSASGRALDGSGYQINVTSYTYVVVSAPDGTIVNSESYAPEDPNGNYLQWTLGSGASWNLYDTLHRLFTLTQNTDGTETYSLPNASGSTSSYNITFARSTVCTNFAVSSTLEYCDYAWFLQSISLPDGTSYSFTYDCDPGSSSGHPICGSSHSYYYGELTSMTLPTGGTIGYAYSNFNDAYGSAYRWIAGRTTPDSSTAWSYSGPSVVSSCSSTQVNCQQQVTVTKPSGDATVYTFTLNGGAWPTEIQPYTGSASSGTLLATTTNCYSFVTLASNKSCSYGVTTASAATNIFKTASTTALPIPGSTSISTTTQYDWDTTLGNLAHLYKWNFGSSTSGTADRTTTTTYLTGSNYSSRNIINRPASVTVTDASSSTVAQTLYSYDGSSLASATGRANHDDTNYGTGMNYRGNLTQVQRLVTGSTYLTSSMTYDMLGNAVTSTDPNGNTTSFDYTDNFYDDPGNGSTPTTHSLSTATNAYVKTITHPTVNSVTLTDTFGYYWGTGQVAFSTDANSNTTYSHFYDDFSRRTSTAFPNSQWTRITYNSTDTQVDTYVGTTNTTASTSCSVCGHSQTVLDALVRVSSQNLVNDPDGETYAATTYDSTGRVATVSNPYRTTSDTTYGLETPAYDGIGRTTQVTHADSDVAHTYYGTEVSGAGGQGTQQCSTSTYGMGFPILVVDEVGSKSQNWTDGFGRMIEADEPNASGTLNVKTCYTYDLNNNLIGVLGADGSQTRSYTYDLLSRVTTAVLPETKGVTTYFYYTASGGSLCSGDPAAICRRTDARSITTTYAYDALNRQTSKSYNDSSPTTPTVKYGYDATALSGCTTTPPSLTITNGLGRRTSMCDGSGATSWAYDSIGDILTQKKTINGQTNTISYWYNLNGTPGAITYPSNRTVVYPLSNALRPTAAADLDNHINFVSQPSGAMYAPHGGLAVAALGYVSGVAISQVQNYNNRLQPTAFYATNGGITSINLSYSYSQSSHNNGNITTQTNNVTSGRTQTFTYDPLNRLLSAQAAATSGGDCWGQDFGNNATPPTLGDDALANLLWVSSIKCSSPAPNWTVNSYNQLSTSGLSYDNAGNSLNDGAYSYTYDAESRIITASGMSGGPYCYSYDGDGLRVMKAHASGGSCTGSPTVDMLYWRSVSGDTLAETDSTGSTSNSNYNEYVFFAGLRVAQSNPSSGHVYYYFADSLGSTRAVTNESGSPCYEVDYFPYGQENTPSGFTNTCSTNYRFTGYERDPETGNEYAFARYYSPRLGRLMSVDPLGGDPSNPQSLNRYTYVQNNPLNLIDPSGLFGQCALGSGQNTMNGDGTTSCGAPPCDPSVDPSCGGGGGEANCGGGIEGCPIGTGPPPPPVSIVAPKPTNAQMARNATKCQIVDPFLGSLEWTTKLGAEVQLGPVEAGASIYKNMTTGQTGVEGGANAALFSVSADRQTPRGGSITGSAPPAQWSFSFLGFNYNLSTNTLQFSPSKDFSLGLQAIVGMKVSFNPDTWVQLNLKNDACRALGGR